MAPRLLDLRGSLLDWRYENTERSQPRNLPVTRGRFMLEKIFATTTPFAAHLHRHILQLFAIRHGRAPASVQDERRAIYEYLTRGKQDRTGQIHVHVNAELVAWLEGEDEVVKGWRPVPRLAGLIYQLSGDIRKRYDLETERDYKEFACYLALSVRTKLRWPEEVVPPALREILWEPAPGVLSRSRVGVTRGMQFVRRNAERMRSLDLTRSENVSKLLLGILSDIDEGKLPRYILSPDQYEYLATPVSRHSNLRLTGLLHHLLVERGLVKERDLARKDVVDTVRREIPTVLSRMRLPADLREAHREYLARITPIAPPAISIEPEPIVTVVGPLSHGSGLGAAARACVEAFKTTGIKVEILNLKAAWGRTDEDAGAAITERIRGDINVIHFNPDVIIENLSRFKFEQFEGRYNIGYFVWETSAASFAHRLGADLVDEIWVPTEFCRQIFERVTDKPVVVVRTPVPKVDDIGWASRRYFGIPDEKFTFAFTFDGASRFTRKNPLGIIEAFQRAFPTETDVQLVLKTQNTDHLYPTDERQYAEIRRQSRKDRRILVIDEGFSSNEVHGMIGVSDCYVTLHRAEGFGYGMAEAMKLRVPVIATAYSGNADFTTEATSYPVRCRLIPVAKRDFVYQDDGQEWADPDLDHAAERMREVRHDPNRKARTDRAYELIRKTYNEEAVGRTYRERIEAIRADLGSETLAANRGAQS